MRLAIVATPPLLLVSVATLGLALRPPAAPQPPSHIRRVWPVPRLDHVHSYENPTCEQAHTLHLIGRVTGGVSHLELAGPVIYTDVTTDQNGFFTLSVPVDGDVCELIRKPVNFAFSDGSMHVSYTIDFGR